MEGFPGLVAEPVDLAAMNKAGKSRQFRERGKKTRRIWNNCRSEWIPIAADVLWAALYALRYVLVIW